MLNDVFVEVINSNPASPSGYEREHEALQGMSRYDEAVRTSNDIRCKLERSTDAQIRREFVPLVRIKK